jgi:hypothetical protein
VPWMGIDCLFSHRLSLTASQGPNWGNRSEALCHGGVMGLRLRNGFKWCVIQAA